MNHSELDATSYFLSRKIDWTIYINLVKMWTSALEDALQRSTLHHISLVL